MEDKEYRLRKQQYEIGELREKLDLSRKDFAVAFGIPLRTVEDWEAGKRKMPDYVLRLMQYKVRIDMLQTKQDFTEEVGNVKNINIICDEEGKNIVLINDIGNVERYNIYKMRMLVRHDSDGKKYLYDFVRTKKETSSPSE